VEDCVDFIEVCIFHSSGPEQEPVTGPCGYGNRIWDSKKVEEFFR
jgi:hypothetical protein